VLAATQQAFAEHGYAGLSIEDVAQRAGVNKTTIYRRWPTKADLVLAALIALRGDAPELPDTGSLRGDLLVILRHLARQMITPHRRAIMHAVFMSHSEPELKSLILRLRRERPAIPPLVIERAIRRGEIPRGSSSELITAALLGPLHSRTWKDESVSDRFLVALVNLVVSGAVAGGAVT
jgi:AcrR family transcriptional regulator